MFKYKGRIEKQSSKNQLYNALVLGTHDYLKKINLIKQSLGCRG